MIQTEGKDLKLHNKCFGLVWVFTAHSSPPPLCTPAQSSHLWAPGRPQLSAGGTATEHITLTSRLGAYKPPLPVLLFRCGYCVSPILTELWGYGRPEWCAGFSNEAGLYSFLIKSVGNTIEAAPCLRLIWAALCLISFSAAPFCFFSFLYFSHSPHS